ncbi:MAG: replication-associated recombination protein A [Planctomycetota bacterium]|nr:replication-associated recombination protein A [Planctomycetota bacterium]
MSSLFQGRAHAPLAERVRPREPADVFGQDGVLAAESLLGNALRTGEVPSLVLWGPPGTGKTTLARLLASTSDMAFEALSAVTSGVKDVRAVIAQAKERKRFGERTLLFVDEIHRFNRAQQDAFLPHIEDGTIVLVGATTENPGFSLIGALLSRTRVVVLEPLDDTALRAVIARALAHPDAGLAEGLAVDGDAEDALVAVAGGDARRILNVLESAVELAEGRTAAGPPTVTADDVEQAAQARLVAYDRSGDGRYDLLSAFHKSLRGSDTDAALYWMARMLEGGEDPLVIVRRMVAMAAEDIGLADPRALRIALDAKDAIQFLGQPEGELPLVQAVVFLATAPKSNSVTKSLKAARTLARESADLPVPLHIRNAPTRLAKDLGHGAGYRYPHDHEHAFVPQRYLPEPLDGRRLYAPKPVGDERETERRLQWWAKLRSEAPPPT